MRYPCCSIPQLDMDSRAAGEQFIGATLPDGLASESRLRSTLTDIHAIIATAPFIFHDISAHTPIKVYVIVQLLDDVAWRGVCEKDSGLFKHARNSGVRPWYPHSRREEKKNNHQNSSYFECIKIRNFDIDSQLYKIMPLQFSIPAG